MDRNTRHGVGSEHILTHRRPPRRWQDGFPLGNGRLGVMVWGDGAPLSFTLDHANLWDLRGNPACLRDPRFSYAGLRQLLTTGRQAEAKEVFEDRGRRENPAGPTKIYAGRAELELGPATVYEGHLDLRRAVVTGRLRTAAGMWRFRAFVHHDLNVFCLRLTGPAQGLPVLRVRSLVETGPELTRLKLPEPVRTSADGLFVLSQEVPDSPCYAVAWTVDGPDWMLAVESAADAVAAVAAARQTWATACERGMDGLWRGHRAAWREFWAGADVCLPEADLTFLWHYGLYLLAGSSRPGTRPPGLQGVWAMDGLLPPWRGDYHCDMNVQETFWPAAPTGHLDLLDTWCNEMKAAAPRARALTRRFFGTEGTFWPSAWLPDFTLVPGWYTVQLAWSHGGWLGWLVWLRWRHSLDREWLMATGYPLLADVFRFYRANLEAGADGRLHVPLSTSPEYHDNRADAWARDPNVDIAIIRRTCDWVLEMEAALGLSELSPTARDIHDRLVPYALGADGALDLWPGHPLDESHRHPSHLMAIHPAMDLTTEGSDADRATIAASVGRFLALGQYFWAGHTYAQWTSLAAVIGQPGVAYDSLRQYADHWIGPNGLHFNRDQRQSGRSCYTYSPGALAPFTLEASCGICAGMCDMLLQGWGDVVRVFPVIPAHWRDLAFRDLLCEGAFRVSAVRSAGLTQWVRVKAGVTRLLRLRDPFDGAEFASRGPALRRAGRDLLADLRRGQSVTLWRPGLAVSLAAALRRPAEGERAWLGLR